ncbi:MAG: hypothetical protein HYV26_08480 [Candidatus Hydrogenedentes bacterium]|nr:hypothetical protein [Candidatus Hydrogenedentota bacterium]
MKDEGGTGNRGSSFFLRKKKEAKKNELGRAALEVRATWQKEKEARGTGIGEM